MFRPGGVITDQGVVEQVAVFGSTSATGTGAAILVSGVLDGAPRNRLQNVTFSHCWLAEVMPS